jgi:phage FluMu gp28-like protein
MCWWVAPVYQQTERAYRTVLKTLPPDAIAANYKSTWRIELTNGSAIEFKSADRFDNLRGARVDFLVVDEAAMIDREAWEATLRPTLSDTQGRAMFISTPRGRNWFYELFVRGQDSQYPEYESFTFPTSSNPYIEDEEIEEARATLPSNVFRQEYCAEFLEDSAGVFRNIRNCVKGSLEEPQSGHQYVIGWDPAKHADFSVITVVDVDVEPKHVVAFQRFTRVDYTLQLQRLEALAKRYNYARAIMDSTGQGDPLLEQVMKAGLSIDGIHFTNAKKQQIIENLALQIEQEKVSFPEIPELINELSIYRYEVTRARNVTYAAPSGYHDDCVISLALAVQGITHRPRPGIYSLDDDIDVWRPFGQELAMRGYPTLHPAKIVEETKRDISRVWIPKLSEEGRRKKVRNILLDHEEIVQAPREKQANALFTLIVENKPRFTDGGFDADKLRADIEAVVSELFDG